MPYSSWFSYSVQRQYPYRWFTPVAVVGAVALTILFTFINLAANGYRLETVYVTDPNVTLSISKTHWYNRAPWSWSFELQSSCAAQNMQLGTQFFTNHSGLTYILERVWTGTSADNTTTTLPAMAYLNYPLEDCHVDNVDVEMRRSSRSGLPSPWWVWDASYADASAHCTVATATGSVTASFGVHYQDHNRDYAYVLNADPLSSASIWWGTRLVNKYWQGSLWAMSATNWTDNTNQFQWDLASFNFTVVDESDIQSMNMFNLSYKLVDETGWASNPHTYPLSLPEVAWYNNEDLPLSAIMTEAQGFAKALYSLILVDLGQVSLSNLLLDVDDLQYALQAKQDVFRTKNNLWLPQYNYLLCGYTETEAAQIATTSSANCDNFNRVAAPNNTMTETGPNTVEYRLDQAYDLFKDQMGPLNTSSATIYSQYACSVPVRRGAGNVALAIIIADLVGTIGHIQAIHSDHCWRLRRSDSTANACSRCTELGDALPLTPPATAWSKKGASPPITSSRALHRATSGESTLALLDPEASANRMSRAQSHSSFHDREY